MAVVVAAVVAVVVVVAMAMVEVEAEVGGGGGNGGGAPGLKAVTLSTSHINAIVTSRPTKMRPGDEAPRLCGGDYEAESTRKHRR